MSTAARLEYDKLPKLTPEEIRLARCPIVIRNDKLFVLDVQHNILIPLKNAFKRKEV